MIGPTATEIEGESSAQGRGARRRSALSLGEIFALERQHLRDRGRSDSELRRRDREIGRALSRIGGEGSGNRRVLYRGWLRSLGGEAARDAARMEKAVAAAAMGLVLAGAISGGGTALGLLRYDGSTPINLLHFVGVFVVLQVLLLVAWIVALAAWRGGWRAPGAVTTVVGGTVHWVLRRGFEGERRDALRADLEWLRSVGGWYSAVERWSVARLGQIFGVSFNVGALAVAALLMATSDLAFAWRSTIDWRPEQIHGLLAAISVPWGSALPAAVPSLELVEASRHFRGTGAPALSPELMARWWSFLILALLCYGLVPRALTWWFSELGLRRALRWIDLDRGDFADLHDRLTLPLVETPGTDPNGDPSGREGLATDRKPIDEGRAWAIVWRDAPIDEARVEAIAGERLRWGIEKVLAAGGGTDANVDGEALGALDSIPKTMSLLLLAESFDPPTKELHKFLCDAAERLGPSRDLVVCLVELRDDGAWSPAEDSQIAIWRRALATLRLPRLRVVTRLDGKR
ncbi:MAG: hypothetical protein CME06_05210 [Gemmatimonadetes bacterium]|nr:hypothetical protein [Gemmatimonadota bacterium]